MRAHTHTHTHTHTINSTCVAIQITHIHPCAAAVCSVQWLRGPPNNMSPVSGPFSALESKRERVAASSVAIAFHIHCMKCAQLIMMHNTHSSIYNLLLSYSTKYINHKAEYE